MQSGFAVAAGTVASVQTKEYDELLKLLRETREAAGISQETLSKMLQRSRTFISKIEAGTRRVDVIEFSLIATALGQSSVSLLAELEKRLRMVSGT